MRPRCPYRTQLANLPSSPHITFLIPRDVQHHRESVTTQGGVYLRYLPKIRILLSFLYVLDANDHYHITI